MSQIPEFDPNSGDYDREVIEPEEPTTDRSLARRVALQALYELDSTAHPIGDVITYHLEAHPHHRRVRTYITRLINGVTDYRLKIDDVLREYAPEWPLEQVAIVDRNILRMALFEFAIDLKTPISVSIDEAVNLGRLFGTESSPRFINGVLGALAGDVEVVRKRLAVPVVSGEDGVE